MPLPKNNVVIKYELTLPSNGKKVSYRPFLVGEQKILLMALESGTDEIDIINAIKQIIENCSEGTLKKEEIDEMPLFDLEWFFLKVRMKSVGEIVEVKYQCQNKVNDKQCNHINECSINLESISNPIPEKGSNRISLDSNMGIVLKYPTFSIFQKLKDANTNNLSKFLDLLCDLLDYGFDATTIYKDFTKEEAEKFLNTLTNDQFKKIGEFIEKIPTIKANIPFKCGKCGYEESIPVEGLTSFFG